MFDELNQNYKEDVYLIERHGDQIYEKESNLFGEKIQNGSKENLFSIDRIKIKPSNPIIDPTNNSLKMEDISINKNITISSHLENQSNFSNYISNNFAVLKENPKEETKSTSNNHQKNKAIEICLRENEINNNEHNQRNKLNSKGTDIVKKIKDNFKIKYENELIDLTNNCKICKSILLNISGKNLKTIRHLQMK